jgi:hypothetical protein
MSDTADRKADVDAHLRTHVSHGEQYCLAHCCDFLYGEYWFRLSRLSMMVLGSFASYTKTKSVESAV